MKADGEVFEQRLLQPGEYRWNPSGWWEVCCGDCGSHLTTLTLATLRPHRCTERQLRRPS